jgi:hypothetical protein
MPWTLTSCLKPDAISASVFGKGRHYDGRRYRRGDCRRRIAHGFSFANYLAELGAPAQSDISAKSSLDRAMRDAFRKRRRFLMTVKGLTEDEAISLMSVRSILA